ncbi:MAG: type IV pilus assembly protein PilM [bacterium]
MEIFQNFLEAIKGLFKSTKSDDGSDRVVGIDIGTSSIKLVEIRKADGKAYLETYSTLALGSYASTDVGAVTNLSDEILTKALTEAVTNGSVVTKNAALSIPSSASLVFIVELPGNVAEKDLDAIVPVEARKYIPIPITEVALNYWVLPNHDASLDTGVETKQDKTEVLVAAIRNEALSKYQSLAKAAGLEADVFEIEIFSEIRAAFGHELSAVLIVDMGASKTKVAIVEYGVVRNFHIINRGSFDISSNIAKSLTITFERAEDLKRKVGIIGEGADKQASDIAKLSVDYILSEIGNVIQTFERKYNKPVSKIILSGAGSLLPGFRDLAAKTFHIETISANPFEKVTVPDFVVNVLAETGPEFSVALGVALRKLG